MQGTLGAAGKKKWHVGVYMNGPGRRGRPLLKANGAAVPAAANLRKQVLGWGHGHPHQLAGILTIELQLENTAYCCLGLAFCILPGQPEELGDAVAQRSDECQPGVEFGSANLRGSREPKAVVRQIEIAGAAGNGAAVLDGAQEFRIAQGSHEVAADHRQVLPHLHQVRHQGLQTTRVNPAFRLKLLQDVDVAFELLEYFAARIAARGNGKNFKQARHGRPGTPGIWEIGVVRGLGIEKFKPEKGAHALIERLLVSDRCRFRLSIGSRIEVRVHRRIVSQPEAQGKP